MLLVAAVEPHTALLVVDAQRRQLVARLQLMRREQRAAGADLLHRLTSDAAVTRVEAHLRWLDLCEERLRTDPTSPARPITQEDL